MDCCFLRHGNPTPTAFTVSSPYPPPSFRKPLAFSTKTVLDFPNDPLLARRAASGLSIRPRRVFSVITSAGASHCEPSSSLNSPLEPRSQPGRFLSSVLQNHRQLFHIAVADELKLLADVRDGAVSRMRLSVGSDEACLHRRVALLKEQECQLAVEDVMYMLIFYKFSEIKVPLVPRLSRCIYNGRLEIWPSRDWELESIHSLDVLEMVKEHVTTVSGLRADSSVTDHWATTKIPRLKLSQVYAASILHGYFLKSASLRHHLEQGLALVNQDNLGRRTPLQFQQMCPYGLKNLLFGGVSNVQSMSYSQGSTNQEMKRQTLKCYVKEFDPDALQRCAKLKSKEAVNLIESHCCALFWDEKVNLVENDHELILTSFSSLKRLALEAVAFGSFLRDTEEYIDTVYKLKENN